MTVFQKIYITVAVVATSALLVLDLIKLWRLIA